MRRSGGAKQVEEVRVGEKQEGEEQVGENS